MVRIIKNINIKNVNKINQFIGAICGIKKYLNYNFNLTN